MASVTDMGDGRYKVRWREGGKGSKERAKILANSTLKKAQRFAAQMEEKVSSGESTDHRALDRTLNEWFGEWEPTVTSWQPNTRKTNRSKWSSYVEANLGRYPIRSIDKGEMKRFVVKMQAAGWQADTVRKTVGLVAGTLEHAYEVSGYRDRDNPARRLKLPGAKRKSKVFLNPAQIELLAYAMVHPNRVGAGTRKPGLREQVHRMMAEGMTQRAIAEKLGVTTGTVCYHANTTAPPAKTFPQMGTLVRFAAYTGLRAGEIAALTPANIGDGQIVVDRSIVRYTKDVAEEHGLELREEKDTKTGRERRVPIPSLVMAELEPMLAMRRADEPLFQMPKGGPLHHTNLLHHHFEAAVEQAALVDAGIRGLRFHDLRHTYAALLIDSGVNVLAVSRLMGHSSTTVTLNVYGHLFNEYKDQVVAALDAKASGVVREMVTV